jgi:hypothetical protein
MIKKSSTFPLFATVTIVMIALAVAGISVAQTGAASHPDLTGHWQLNRDLSEDAQAKLAGMGAGGGHHGGGGQQGANGQGIEEIRNLLLDAPTRLVVAQDDQKVVLTDPDGHARTLPTNNRAVKIDGRDVRTKWENNRLVSETRVGNATLFETYERSPSAHQLIVASRMEVHGQQVSVRRVYDAVRE